MANSNKVLFSEWLLYLKTTELRSLIIIMVQRGGAPLVERVSLNRPPALRLVLGESTGLFGLGLERSSRDQARRHFALATSCFQEDYCKTEQGIGLLTISIRQRAANLDLPNLRCEGTASLPDKPFIITGERVSTTRYPVLVSWL